MITAKDALAADLAKLTPARVKAATGRELDDLAKAIRQFLIDRSATTDGLSSENLDTIELTLALHRVFESPDDRIVWDGRHQSDTHKVITGHADRLRTPTAHGGMGWSGTPGDGADDLIEASHGGRSISVALGMALAKALNGDTRSVVAVIGAGSLSEGIAHEGLNHAAVATHTNLVIVLHDSGCATSPGSGALQQHLQRMSPGSTEPEQLFTALGLDYIGPVDGGHIESVVVALERARSSTQIPIVHVKTGSRPAVPVGHAPDGSPRTRYPDLAAAVIGSEMARDDRIVAITPSLLDASGLAPVFKRYPDRCFDPGLEEQHATTMTLGLALEGYKPVIVIQSAFMPRAFDQLLHEVCRRNLPTLMLAVGIGFASDDDPARRGLCDCSCWRGLPNLRVMYPKDRFELERMVRTGLREMTGPTVVAMPGGPADEFDPSVLDEPSAVFDRPQVVTPGKEMTIIAVGRMFATARDVAARLRQAGVDCGLVNLRHLQPLPEEALAGILAGVTRVVTLEEGVLDGGVGSAIAALVMDRRLRCEVLRRGVPTQCVAPLSRDELCRLYGLDVEGVLKAVREFWKA